MTRADDIKTELDGLAKKARRNRRFDPANDWQPTGVYTDCHDRINALLGELEELERPPVAPPLVFSEAHA